MAEERNRDLRWWIQHVIVPLSVPVIAGVFVIVAALLPKCEPTPPTPAPSADPSLEDAIQDYYSLIREREYETAFQMLSDEFRKRVGLTTLDDYVGEWERSGPATVIPPIDISRTNSRATVTLRLHYSAKRTDHRIRYEFVRDETRGSQRFDYWLLLGGEKID